VPPCYRLLALAACTLLGTVKMSCTSRDPQCGQRRRLSRRDSGKPRPLVHTSVSMSELGAIDALFVPMHAVLLAGRATCRHAPAVRQGLAERLHSHNSAWRTYSERCSQAPSPGCFFSTLHQRDNLARNRLHIFDIARNGCKPWCSRSIVGRSHLLTLRRPAQVHS
jgi:hypothetical protein